jgi:hypothetical protein
MPRYRVLKNSILRPLLVPLHWFLLDKTDISKSKGRKKEANILTPWKFIMQVTEL